MKCPYCQSEFDYALATQIVHVDVLVDEKGNWHENAAPTLEESAYEFESPVGDYACPHCGEYVSSLEEFAGI